MSSSSRPLLGLSLVAFVPTLSIVFTLHLSGNEAHSQVFFALCKAWVLVVPTIWFLKVEGNPASRSLPDRDGLLAGAATGIAMSGVIVVTWLALGDSIETSLIVQELEGTGLTDPNLYIAGMIYWIFLNSLLEEYVFRWFITTKSFEILNNEGGAVVSSALLFTLHHSLALHLFGFEAWQIAIASFGLLSAAAVWSWLYMRYRSIWVCWLSHAICDVAVFGIGYQIIFS